MSSFLENEAEESDNDYDSDEVARHPRKKRAKPTQDSEEEEEEDDEEALRNEMKDLINDEEEEEEGESDDDDDEEGGKKRSRDEEESEEDLDDDDLDLLEENLGVKLSRKKKFKRVRRLIDEESDDEGEKDEREAIANELFDDEDGEQRPKNDRRRRGDEEEDDRYRALSGSEESDDEGNFIVDDNDEPISRPRKKKGYRYNDEAMQQAQDVFGVEFDFDDFQNYGVEDEYEDEQDDEYEEEEDEDGEGGARIRKKSKAKKKSSRKSIFEVYEPAELEKSFLQEQDKKITTADLPERFQLRSTPVTPADDGEIDEEADWIYLNAFSQPTITIQIQDAAQQIGRSIERGPLAGKKPPTAVPKIRETLKFIRNQSREVPFIQFYRKEYVRPELEIDDLWTIYKWDEKWCQLLQRKANMKKLVLDMQRYQGDLIIADPDAPLPEGARIIGDADIERIDRVNSFDELRDCWVQFQLYYGSLFPAMKQAKAEAERKRRMESRLEGGEEGDQVHEEEDVIKDKMSSLKLIQRKDFYTVCQEAGILGLATRFGLTPEQFGENLRDAYQKYEVEQIPIEPEEFANDYICTRFPDVEAVLKAAKYMVARQLASDPIVRKVTRQVFFERAVIHVRPTKKGMKEVDESHPCFTYKYLRNKPVSEFSNEQFLHLVIAKQEGNLTVKITMDKANVKGKEPNPTYFDEIKALYQRDEFSSNVQKWNKLRLEALETALDKFLYPSFEVELIAKLTKESQEGVIKRASKKLHDWLKIGPYVPNPEVTEDEDFDIREGLRVLGFAYAPQDESPSFAVLVDGDGEVVEHLRLPNFMLRRTVYATEKEKDLREKDKEKLKNFILDKKPHVICVGSKDLTARYLIDEIMTMAQELHDEENIPVIPVTLLDDELSTVYMNSKRAMAEFHDFPPVLRQAVSLARRLQDPLIEFSQLCTADEEILCMKYHSLQDHVPKDELLSSLQQEFIYRVNEVGVDINRILVHNYTSQLLQFVCGLGPRKAAALVRNLKKSPTPLLETRTQLMVNCGIGEVVFQNCAGFIKLDTAQLSDTGTETYIEVLDSTRIHPEAYDLARKMAIDALEYDETNELPSAGALEEIMENPENLKDLDLDAFAEQLAKEGCGNKKITLYDIREELNHPYKDLRQTYKLTAEDSFHLLTKESPETFYVGKLIIGTVINVYRRKPLQGSTDENNPVRNDETGLWMCPVCKKNDFLELNEVWNHYDAELCPGQAMGVRVRLDNGLVGLVPIEKISDHEVINPDERVKPGMTVHARITKVVADKYFLEMTCRTSDLNDRSYHWRPPKDFYYDFDAEDEDFKEEEDKKKKKAGKQNIFKRIIVHPSFHNIDFKQSEQMLESMHQGEAIFRPSSKGPDHLTLTWKVADGIYQHIAILEKNKDNAFSLGHQLIIDGEIYEDLDEIMARYITPMASFAREITSFRHYKGSVMGNKREAEKILLEEKKKRNTIVYIISPSKDFPGKFLLSYPNKEGKVIHEWLSIKPIGFKYREEYFRRLKDVIKRFQENWFTGKSLSTPLLSAPSQMSHQQLTSPAPGLRFPTPQGTPVMASPFHVPSSAAAAAAAWNRASTSMPPPRRTPTPQRTPNSMPPPPDPWVKLVQPGTPSHATPGASSQMSISPSYSPANKGDATPLLDEWA